MSGVETLWDRWPAVVVVLEMRVLYAEAHEAGLRGDDLVSAVLSDAATVTQLANSLGLVSEIIVP